MFISGVNCNISAILVAIIKLINISKEKQISYNLIRYIKQNNIKLIFGENTIKYK
jgi:hypothetical protein